MVNISCQGQSGYKDQNNYFVNPYLVFCFLQGLVCHSTLKSALVFLLWPVAN